MKKKILLFICLVTVATLSFAQEMAQDWNTPMGQPRTAKSAYSKELVQIDANGNTYVCGEFSQDFTIGSYDLMAVGNSAYLAKIDNTGNVQWAVAIQGNVAPAYITTDSEGNVYITASSDGDAVILNSTDNNSKTLTGNSSSWGDYYNTLFAQYDANGVLKNSDIYLHDNKAGTSYVNPMGLVVNENNIYLALTMANDIKIGETTFSGSEISVTVEGEEGEQIALLPAVRILSFDKNLSLQKEIASIVFEAGNYYANIPSFAMTVNEGNLYAAFYAAATVKVSAGTSSFTIASDYDNSGFVPSYHRNLGLFRVNNEGNIDVHKSFIPENLVSAFSLGYEYVDNVFCTEDSWTITGAYNGNFLFNENAPATGDYTAAPFFVTLNPNTADLQKSNYWSEEYKLTDAAVGDALLVGLYKSTDKTSTLNVYDFGTKNITDVETTKAGTSINGIASTGAKVAICKATEGAESADLAISMNTLSGITAGINESVATVTVSAYPNPVKDILNFSEVCDVTIVNGQGSVVKAVSATTQISVDDLAAGYYIAKIKTADGTTVIPFIKK